MGNTAKRPGWKVRERMMSLDWGRLCSDALEKSKKYAGRSQANGSEEKSRLEVEIWESFA